MENPYCSCKVVGPVAMQLGFKRCLLFYDDLKSKKATGAVSLSRGTEEMMQPCSIYLHGISSVATADVVMPD